MAGDPGAAQWPRWALIALAVAGLWAHANVFDFLNDDAFISFRYADNLVRHGELVYNPGERVEGYTNFLWTILMAGVLGLGLDIVTWSKALGIVFGAGTLLVVARFTARYMGQASRWDALAPALLAAAPAYACWSSGGLETQQFTFFATLGWTAYLGERQAVDSGEVTPGWRGWPRSGLYFALSAMARPEGMLFFGLTGLHRLGEMLLVDRTIKPEARDWIWGIGFAVVFVPFFAWRWTYYGYPFPNTYYIKTGATGAWKRGLPYVQSWVVDHALWIVPLFAGLRRGLPGRREGRLLTLGALYIVVIAAYVTRVGGDFMALHRFLVPLMPIAMVLLALGLRLASERLIEGGTSPRRVAIGGLIAATLFALHVSRVDRRALEVGSEDGVDSIGWLSEFHQQCTAIGRHLARTAPPDGSMATTAAGIIPFYSRLYTVDMLGLNDEWVAHNVEPRGNRPGHTKSAPMDYILGKQVDYLVFHPTIRERAPRKGAGEKRAWKARGYQWEAVKVADLQPPWWGYWRRMRN